MISPMVEAPETGDQGPIGQRWPGHDERSSGAGAWAPGRTLALLAGAALLVSAVALGQRLLLPDGPGGREAGAAFLRSLLAACAWIGVGGGVARLARRVPLRPGTLRRAVPVHLAGIGAAALAVNLLAGAAWAAAGLWPPGAAFGGVVLQQTVAHLHANALVYALVAGAASARRRGGGRGPAPSAEAPDRTGGAARIAVPEGGRTVLLDVERVDWIEAAGDYATLHAGGREYLLSERMHALEERFRGHRFARTHRSAIVNLGRVREVRPEPAGNATLVLRDGTRVPLARRRRAGVEARLGI